MTAEKAFAAARVREVTLATQGFVFFCVAQAYKVFAYAAPPGYGRNPWVWVHIALMFSPFVIARIPALMAVTPRLFLRDGARVDLHEGGLVYTFDAVKRPLFVSWANLESLQRTRFGLVFRVKDGPDLFEGMPRFQAEFWRGKTGRPVRIRYIERFAPERGLWLSLAAARRAGVRVEGFDRGHSHQGSMAAISSSDQPK